MRRDMGLRRLSLDLPLAGAAVGVDIPFDVPASFSLIPLINEVCDLEKAE
jgi:hypothetical protein